MSKAKARPSIAQLLQQRVKKTISFANPVTPSSSSSRGCKAVDPLRGASGQCKMAKSQSFSQGAVGVMKGYQFVPGRGPVDPEMPS